MRATLEYTPQAINDLDNVYDGVLEASCDKNTADKYISDLVNEIDKKRDFPLSTPVFDFYDLMLDIHHFTFKAYIVFYKVENNTLRVLRVLPSKMDYMRKLKF